MGNYLLQSYLDAGVRAHPEKLALVDDQRSISYQQLHRDANRIAICLRASGVRRPAYRQ